MDKNERDELEEASAELAINESRIFDHIATTFRWLMATLFAANGGAAAALISDRSRLPGDIYGLGWFVAGIVLSIMTGILSAAMGLRILRPMTNIRVKIRQRLLTDGAVDLEPELSELNKKQKLTWKAWFPTYAGLLSLLCFIVGAVIVGWSLNQDHRNLRAPALQNSPTPPALPSPPPRRQTAPARPAPG